MRRKINLRNFFRVIIIFTFTVLLLSSCVAGSGLYSETNPAGFFKGIWHGWIAPFVLILSFFPRWNHLTIYEINNTGWWYNLGFYIAVISPFGSISLTREKKG